MILITGGTGFIGTQLIQQLIASGKSVRAIMRKSSTIPEKLRGIPSIEWIEADVLDYFSLEDAFKDISHVYHCAAFVSYLAADKKELLKTNIEGTAHVVNLCLQKQCRLLHVSSVAALGSNEKGMPITEKTPWLWNADKSNYSISKYEAEREVWRGISEGLDAVIVNPSVVIGTSSGRSESTKIFQLLEEGLSYYPVGSTGLIDVEDVCSLMIKLMNRLTLTGEGFLLNTENVTYHALFSRYCEIAGKTQPKHCINSTWMSIAWRITTLLRALKLTKLSLSKEIGIAASKNAFYSNKKLLDTLPYVFKPIDVSLQEIHDSLSKTHIHRH